MAGRTLREEQAGATRELLLTAAERLFAEHGVYAVSNRQVSEAAGQGNNTAVGYHFGTKTDLVRAIVRRHSTRIEEIRARLVADLTDPDDVRGWVDCLVRPSSNTSPRSAAPPGTRGSAPRSSPTRRCTGSWSRRPSPPRPSRRSSTA